MHTLNTTSTFTHIRLTDGNEPLEVGHNKILNQQTFQSAKHKGEEAGGSTPRMHLGFWFGRGFLLK